MHAFSLPRMVVFTWVLGTVALVRADAPPVIPLWAGGAPGSEARRHEPELARDYWVRNIHNPSVTVFLPPKAKANGAGVVIFPGGGHRELVYRAEGVEPAEFLNSLGVAAFVVKYRLAREEGSTYTIARDARADGKRAMRLVRSHAAEWGLDARRIGVMGFSAGGEMVSMITYEPANGDPHATDPIDRANCRPDFQIVIYPGPLGVPSVVPADTPPAFFVVAGDDQLAPVALDLTRKYQAAHVPVELHLYSRGGHGFNLGYRSQLASVHGWPQRLADWLLDNGILDPTHHPAK